MAVVGCHRSSLVIIGRHWQSSLADSGGGGARGARPPFEIPKRVFKEGQRRRTPPAPPPPFEIPKRVFKRDRRCAPLSTNPGSAPGHRFSDAPVILCRIILAWQWRIQGGGVQGVRTPPPFGPRCRLFNIGPKVGPPLL